MMWRTRKNPVSTFPHRGAKRVAWSSTVIRPRRTIRSLDPERLQSSDFVDFSDIHPSVYAGLKDRQLVKGRIYYKYGNSRFPPKTQGFLYYHRRPSLPLTTGEIRFRLTESADPTCFQNGMDLMRSEGVLPWAIPLFRLLRPHAFIKALLKQDHDIPETILNYGISSRVIVPRFCLAFLEEPFVLRLEEELIIRTVDSQLRIGKTMVPRLLVGKYPSTFKGKLLVRFEQSTLSEHENETSIVMRVLKVLEPVEPLLKDGELLHPIPEPGTLIKSKYYGQVQNMEFNHPFLASLPHMMGNTLAIPTDVRRSRTLLNVRKRTISTLDPLRLNSFDFMDISHLRSVRVERRGNPHMFSLVQLGSMIVNKTTIVPKPFPANTHGFLYLHLKPGLPVTVAQIRFRITPSADPTQFEKGTDLYYEDQPWHLGVLQLAQSSKAPLVEQLYHDGHVELVQAIRRFPQTSRARGRVLGYVEQPFIASMSLQLTDFNLLTPAGVRNLHLSGIFVDWRLKSNPYIGRLLLRFELSTLPQHTDGNFLVLRVLKILDAVKPIDPSYDRRYPVPLPGELLVASNGRVLSYNVDKHKCVRAFKGFLSIPDDKPCIDEFR